jgi:hypothetical protein
MNGHALWAQPKPFPITAEAPAAVYVTFWATLFAAWTEAAIARRNIIEVYIAGILNFEIQ